jgi:hypothetical protein
MSLTACAASNSQKAALRKTGADVAGLTEEEQVWVSVRGGGDGKRHTGYRLQVSVSETRGCAEKGCNAYDKGRTYPW